MKASRCTARCSRQLAPRLSQPHCRRRRRCCLQVPASRLAAATPEARGAMPCFTFYIFNRKGACQYYHEWQVGGGWVVLLA